MGSLMSCCGAEKVDQGVVAGEFNSSWKIFSYKELHAATNGFSDDNLLGEGGFGSVYLGKTSDGHQIAVKKLKSMNSKAEMEFAVEVEVLARVRHKNLLGLRGYCAATDQRLIVYDYMPNLSLLSHLHGQFLNEVQLDWRRRMNIILGSAEALVYLHHEVTPHIIHRDIKASNVLLDSDFEPLVADFGFAKLIPEGVSHMTTRVKGTLGYLAPEYAMWGRVSDSCDVYSFGILLLEIVSGHKPIEKLPGGMKRTITEWAEPLIAKGRFRDLVDRRLRGNYDEAELRRVVEAAVLCVQGESEQRPDMKEVVAILKGRDSGGKGKAEVMRLESVRYGENLMAMDKSSDDEDYDDCSINFEHGGRGGGKVGDESSFYGVFGAMEEQKMHDPYVKPWDKRKQGCMSDRIWWSPQSNSAIIHALILFLYKFRVSCPSRHFHGMDSIEESATAPAAKILVGVPLDGRASSQLLSWAVTTAAHANDTILALHVLVEKEEKRLNSERSRLRQAKAFVISVLGEFAEICQTKQVKLEAKVRTSTSIGRGLADEATLAEANFLVLGRSRNSPKRNSFEITSYCFKNAPQGCSIVGIDIQGPPRKDGDLDSLTYDVPINCTDHSSSSSRWTNKENIMAKSLSPFHKLIFGSISKREKRHSSSESISPRGVLEGPEAESSAVEDCLSPCSSSVTIRRSRTSFWRRLSSMKLFFPRSFSDDLTIKETDACSFYTEDLKPSWRCFTYDEISKATNSFHAENLVGRGGFAEVFKGKLHNGRSVAVKRLAKGNGDQQKEKEFLIELGILGHICHPNTANLIGCCIENGLHLVFDLSCNGTLASALHSKNGKFLEWPVRYKIVMGIARGLHYLHKCCRHRIIHRDIKASNVLLGPDFEPQISDFGLAKWLPKQWTHHSVIPIEGTFGYLAPEYFMHGIVDEKTDVFAFGVLLLEIATGRRPVDTSKQSLLVWAKPLMEAGRIHELADPKLEGKYDTNQMQRLVLTASYCVRQSSIWRPSMNEVLDLLKKDHGSTEAQIWRIPESQVEEMDDCTSATDFYFDF
ncbi:hypothetical protein Cni_G27112 [Canna indica]|uniref:Protein kinase domain-containing protein n=1 Tax=Canna indica TaxID=4628 RepID=A0AAQ3L050_9LILI|nr:hypothetical protein Cni_G27112 [Canna indica]